MGIIFLILSSATYKYNVGTDEGIWNYMGHVWIKYDIAPYKGAVENKTPGIFFIYAISNFFFGVNVWFPRLVGIFATVVASRYIYSIGKMLGTSTTGVFSMLFFGLTMAWRFTEGRHPAYTETFMVFFTIISFYYAFKMFNSGQPIIPKYVLYSGLLIGSAIVFKQIAIITTPALFLLLIMREVHIWASLRDNYKTLAIFGIGVLIPNLISLVPLLISGVTIGEYFEGAWLILINEPRFDNPRSFTQMLFAFVKFWKDSKIVYFYPFIILFLILKDNLIKGNIPFMGIVFWMIFDFIGVNASLHYYGHQVKQIIPSFAVASGISLSYLFNLNIFSDPIFLRKKIMVLILIFILWVPIYTHVFGDDTPDTYKELGLWIKENTSADDYVYIWAEDRSTSLAYSERRSPSKYFDTYTISETNNKHMDELKGDLIDLKPTLFLTPTKNEISVPDWLKNLLDVSYILVNEKYGYKVFRLNEH